MGTKLSTLVGEMVISETYFTHTFTEKYITSLSLYRVPPHAINGESTMFENFS